MSNSLLLRHLRGTQPVGLPLEENDKAVDKASLLIAQPIVNEVTDFSEFLLVSSIADIIRGKCIQPELCTDSGFI